MIDIIANSSSFRKIPWQSGTYSIELDINLGNHFNDVDFALSGGGSIFFRFGSNSGSYYASGSQKLYFDSTMPNSNLDYTFVLANSSYDVYKGDTPLILNGTKATGVLERILDHNTQNSEGQFSLVLRGNRPSFHITSGMTFPVNGSYVDNVVVYNDSVTPFSILSGTFDSINFISGLNRLPLFLTPNGSGLIPFSGHLTSATDQNISLILNADFVNTANVLTITGTQFSGSGYILFAPTPATVAFGSFANQLWVVSNTGTVPLRFSPVITKIVTGINITPPTYSGVNLKNFFSGYFDTPSKFYFSDKITWTGGAFHIIQQNNTGIGIFDITGDNPTGLSIGTTTNVAVGETFTLPFDFHITGISAKLATDTSGFFGTDLVYVSVFKGNGVSGEVLANSNTLLGSFVPLTVNSGAYFNFVFPTPISIVANNPYSLVLSGNPEFVGNIVSTPARNIFLLQTTGSVFNGSGFTYNSFTTFTTGNAFFKLDWMPAINANRYKVNIVSGSSSVFASVYSGIYDKYQGYQSFSFPESSLEALPGSPMNFEMTYTGLVSGMNFAQLVFNNIGYSTIVSGLTT